MSCKIALFAEKSAGLQTLKLLEKNDVDVTAVVASPEATGLSTVWNYASKQGHKVIPAQQVRTAELAEDLRSLKIDLILNVYSLYIVHPEILSVPRLGSYNLHPGPLPEMAGLNVPDWAIYHQHETHGVTVHRMESKIDSGAIAFEDRFNIPAHATGLKLSLECGKRGLQLIEQFLHHIITGNPIPQKSQDLSLRNYYPGGIPDNGGVDLNAHANHVVARIRAGNYRPYPSVWGHPVVSYGDIEIGLVDATVINQENRAGVIVPSNTPDSVVIGCGIDSIEVTTVFAKGAYHPAADVLSYPGQLAIRNTGTMSMRHT